MTARQNKRRSRRHSCQVLIDGAQESEFSSMKTRDIGAGGMGLLSPVPVKVRESLAVQLDLNSDGDFVLLSGEVRWVAPVPRSSFYRVGLKFNGPLSPGDSGRWQHFCRNRRQLESQVSEASPV